MCPPSLRFHNETVQQKHQHQPLALYNQSLVMQDSNSQTSIVHTNLYHFWTSEVSPIYELSRLCESAPIGEQTSLTDSNPICSRSLRTTVPMCCQQLLELSEEHRPSVFRGVQTLDIGRSRQKVHHRHHLTMQLSHAPWLVRSQDTSVSEMNLQKARRKCEATEESQTTHLAKSITFLCDPSVNTELLLLHGVTRHSQLHEIQW